jgi:hypothetical protein
MKFKASWDIWAFHRDLKETVAMEMELLQAPMHRHGDHQANKVDQQELAPTQHGDHLIGQQLIQVCR